MSDAVPAVGETYTGAVTVADAGVQGMITLRGDLDSDAVAKAVKSAVGLSMPAQRGIKQGARGGVAWMSPDELMIFCDYAQAESVVAKMAKALGSDHSLVANVSDARAMFTLTGGGVREVIAKGSPADLSPDALPLGELRRSRLGQVAVAYWLTDAETLHLVCFRSVGKFVYDWLCVAAKEGSLVEFFEA